MSKINILNKIIFNSELTIDNLSDIVYNMVCYHNNDSNNCSKIKLYLKVCDINTINDFGSTALHHASYYNNEDIVKLLLENNIDANITNEKGFTAIMYTTNYDTINLISDYVNSKTPLN